MRESVAVEPFQKSGPNCERILSLTFMIFQRILKAQMPWQPMGYPVAKTQPRLCYPGCCAAASRYDGVATARFYAGHPPSSRTLTLRPHAHQRPPPCTHGPVRFKANAFRSPLNFRGFIHALLIPCFLAKKDWHDLWAIIQGGAQNQCPGKLKSWKTLAFCGNSNKVTKSGRGE